jgi:NADH-quinone oxidoreductase subunit N
MHFSFTSTDFYVLLPLLLPLFGAVLVLCLDLLLKPGKTTRTLVHSLSLLSLVAGIFSGIHQYLFLEPSKLLPPKLEMGPLIEPVFRFQPWTVLGTILLLILTLITLILSGAWWNDENEETQTYGEFHILSLFFPVGAGLLLAAKNLMLAFIGLEILSISLYVLVAFRRGQSKSIEAGLKYFLLGAFGAAFFVYGSALIYAGQGTLDMPSMGTLLREGLPQPLGYAAIGGALLFVALFFKASIAPFHMWTPDVYEGAPTPITALMSTGTKAAAFFLLISSTRLFPHEIVPVFTFLAILSILIGNTGALVQTNLKRLLAYSGIAHAGYLLVAYQAMAVGQGPTDAGIAMRALLFYLAVYGITNLAALGVLSWIERRDPEIVTLEGLRGLGRRNPIAAAILAISALSLAGIPPTAGFWAKYQIFAASIQAGQTPLAIIAILGSVIGLYYYLKILVALYFKEGSSSETITGNGFATGLTLGLCATAILLVGILPELFMNVLVNVRL